MHLECEELCQHHPQPQVFPVADKLLEYAYLIERGTEQSDRNYLFTKYMGSLWSESLSNRTWSIMIFLDDVDDFSDLPLIIQLADSQIYMVSMFNEMDFLKG